MLFKSTVKPSERLVAMGGVDYGKLKKNKNEIAFSLNEAVTISEFYKTHYKNGTADLYLGDEATESVLKSMKKTPRILHLSTHGFYLQNPKERKWMEDEEPLLLSGLAIRNK